jgi:ABC-type amino acid transport substrate-binding protein
MILSTSKIKRIKLGIFSIFLCFILVFNSNSAAVQSQFPKKIRIGTRTAAYAIGRLSTDRKTISGFCGHTFEVRLREEISSRKIETTVSNQIVVNENIGGAYVRYQGLLAQSPENKIEIECGPNSLLSGDLTDGNDTRSFKDKITFSKTFYQTGIKLLLRKDKYKALANLSASELDSQIDKLLIGTVKDTTTFLQFVNKGRDKNVTGFSKKNDALKSLDDGSIDAFAADSLIAQTLFEEGVRHNKHNDERQPYKEKDFIVFPFKKGDYLPGFDGENYAIVIKKGSLYEQDLLGLINDALKRIKNSSSLTDAENDYSALEFLGKNTPQLNIQPKLSTNPPFQAITFIEVLALLTIMSMLVIAILAVNRKDGISSNPIEILNQINKNGYNVGGSTAGNRNETINNESQGNEENND